MVVLLQNKNAEIEFRPSAPNMVFTRYFKVHDRSVEFQRLVTCISHTTDHCPSLAWVRGTVEMPYKTTFLIYTFFYNKISNVLDVVHS